MGMNDMIQFFRQMSGRLGSNIYAGVQGQTNPQHISFLRQLQKEMKEKNDLESKLNNLKVVVFDIETTGFYPEKGDYVISIGAVKMTGGQIEKETFYSLIKSDLPLSKEITSLTNIQVEQLITAPSASEVLIQFFKFINSRILVAHHANHEKSFMKKMTRDVMRTKFEHRIVDTSFLAFLSNPIMKSLSLDDVCGLCGVEIKNRHNALGDAKMTANIWSYYLNIAQSLGFDSLHEIYEYLGKFK